MSRSRLDVTILLTTRNRASLLEATLRSMANLDVAGLAWDVLVVDNGSSDDTPRVLAAAAARLPLRVMTEPALGKSLALNAALRTLTAPLVIFTDDDVLHAHGWAQAYVSAARRWPDARLFGGPIEPLFPSGTPLWLTQHRFCEAAFARFACDAPEGPIDHLPFGPNFAVRGAALEGFQLDPELGPAGSRYPVGQDTAMLRRLSAGGHRVIFVPSASVRHVIRDEQITTRWLFRRAHNLGRGRRRQMALVPGLELPFTRAQLVSRVLAVGATHAWHLPFGLPRRFSSALQYHYWRGCLHEDWLIRKSGTGVRSATATAAPAIARAVEERPR